MATHTAVRRSKHATLVANTVDTVPFSSKPKTIEVRNLDSTTVVFFRTDGLGKTQLRHLGTTEVRGWFARINGPDGPCQPTAAKCYRLLRAIMQTATEDGRVAKNLVPFAVRAVKSRSSAR